MILGDINNRNNIANINPRILTALNWLKENYKNRFQKGEIILEEGAITVRCQEVAMMPQQMLEAHRRYIDIHAPQSEEETIGWSSINDIKNCITPYDESRDIESYGDAPQCTLQVRPGQFAIFFPEDAHAPNIGIGNHRKFCIKIAID